MRFSEVGKKFQKTLREIKFFESHCKCLNFCRSPLGGRRKAKVGGPTRPEWPKAGVCLGGSEPPSLQLGLNTQKNLNFGA